MRRHIMHRNHDSIKTILAFAGIKKPEDVNSLVLEDNSYIVSTRYPWVKQIYELLQDSNVAAQTSLFLWEYDPGQYFQINGMNSDNQHHLTKFSCFFPGRTLISAGDIKKEENRYYIQRITLFNFFFSSIIADNDLGFFTPNSINGKALRSILSKQEDDYRIADLDTIYTGKKRISKSNSIVDKMYIGLPWLYNARVEDYIELINRYENEFENYNRHIRDLAKTATNEKELTRDLVNSFNDLKIDMQIKLEMKKEELRKKGILTLVGVCLTAIPYAISLKYETIDPSLLNGLLGGLSVYECASVISDGLARNNLSRDNPLWIIWKWAQKAEKKA